MISGKKQKPYFFTSLLLLTIITFNGCISYYKRKETLSSSNNGINIEAIKKDITPLKLLNNYNPPKSIKEYYKYYHINYTKIPHYFGYFISSRELIAAHIFIPDNSVGTIFLLHGHNGHSADFRFLIEYCLKYNFSVAIYDLPGHGLSTGERSSIEDFSDYVTILNDFINSYKKMLPKPFHLIGHSTGCAIAFEYINNTGTIVFDKIIFLAPLVRNAKWIKHKLGYHLAKLFVKDIIPRKKTKSSSDTKFLELIEKDPLQNKTIPIKFLKAFYSWENKIRKCNISSKPILIIQGTADSIVDWRYNIDFYQNKLESFEVILIGNAKHNLINEAISIRKKVFKHLINYIQNNKINAGQGG